MSQKYIKSKNNNSHNAKTYGKYYAKPVYEEKFITLLVLPHWRTPFTTSGL